MKSALNLPPEQFISAEKLFAKAMDLHPALLAFPQNQLESFRFTRNRIVHYGFSPRDDEATAILLLQTGFRFLSACYKEFFDFDLRDGLEMECGNQLAMALAVFERSKGMPGLHFSCCFSAFGHFIRWAVRPSFIADWESETSIHAEETGVKFDRCEKRKHELERAFGTTWAFGCPIYDDGAAFVCELDEDSLGDHIVALRRGVCANCGLVVPKGCPFLADALCLQQTKDQREAILREFGITDV